jgi:hypothetical protein
VFGRVIQGMDVIDKIVALPKSNQGGALGKPAGANGYADVAGNEPKPRHLVSITDAKVLSRAPGDSSGASFQVLSVTDADTMLHPLSWELGSLGRISSSNTIPLKVER